jgi:hypothetical protein
LWWQAARRDGARVARCLYCEQAIDGVYRLDEGALLDDFCHFLQLLGVGDLLDGVQGSAIQREMGPVVQCLLLDGLKTLVGIESRNALPALLFSAEALMRLVGLNTPQGRHGAVSARGRSGARRYVTAEGADVSLLAFIDGSDVEAFFLIKSLVITGVTGSTG